MKIWTLLTPMLALVAVGCSSGGDTAPSTTAGGTASTTSTGTLPFVAFAQANSSDPWRQVFDSETKDEFKAHDKDFSYEEQTAEDKADKQISQIQTLMLKSPKVLLISPTTDAVQSAVEKVYDSGVPVVLLDRAIPGDKYTCLIAGDNVDIGKQAADFIVQKLNGKGTVLMIQGLGGASATNDRKKGAMDEFAKSPGIKVIEGDDCKYQRQAAQSYMETFLQSNKPFDAVYAHNDEMAIGAYMAWSHSPAKSGKRPLFVGIDGCQKEMIDHIQKGEIDATFKYPIPGPKGVDIAADLLKGKKPTDKKIILPTVMVTKETAEKYLADNPNLAK